MVELLIHNTGNEYYYCMYTGHTQYKKRCVNVLLYYCLVS